MVFVILFIIKIVKDRKYENNNIEQNNFENIEYNGPSLITDEDDNYSFEIKSDNNNN